jgi:hypothetical protein
MSEIYGIRFGDNITKISHVRIKLHEPVTAWTDDEQRVVIEAGTTFEVELIAPVGQDDH